MKRKTAAFMVASILCIIGGVAAEEVNIVGFIDEHRSPEVSFERLLTVIYTNDELEAIKALDLPIDELDKMYPIECLRSRIDYLHNARMWRITYRSEDSILLITYGNEQQPFDKEIRSMSYEKNAIDDLVIGQASVYDVREIDSEAGYGFMQTSQSIPRPTKHYTSDGYYIVLEYDSQWYIIRKVYELI